MIKIINIMNNMSNSIISILLTGLSGFLVGYIVQKSLNILFAVIALIVVLAIDGSVTIGFEEVMNGVRNYASSLMEMTDESIVSALSITTIPFIVGAIGGFFYAKKS